MTQSPTLKLWSNFFSKFNTFASHDCSNLKSFTWIIPISGINYTQQNKLKTTQRNNSEKNRLEVQIK